MKEFVNYFCFGAVCMFIFMACIQGCEKKPEIKDRSSEIDSLKNHIKELKSKTDTVKIEVVKWKEVKKALPKYKTKFNPSVTIDTVLVELGKCDTIVKVDSVLIDRLEALTQNQDTIIHGQEEIISDLDLHNEYLKQEVKKQKRKTIGVIVVAVLVKAGEIIIKSLIKK